MPKLSILSLAAMVGALTVACVVRPIDEHRDRRMANETVVVPAPVLVAHTAQPDFYAGLVMVAQDSPYYHLASCRRLARNHRILTRREAMLEHKSPCPVCMPDRRG